MVCEVWVMFFVVYDGCGDGGRVGCLFWCVGLVVVGGCV